MLMDSQLVENTLGTFRSELINFLSKEKNEKKKEVVSLKSLLKVQI